MCYKIKIITATPKRRYSEDIANVIRIKQIEKCNKIKQNTLLSDNVYTTDSSDLAGILSILRNKYAFSAERHFAKNIPLKEHTNLL
jgi:hypothetical protein